MCLCVRPSEQRQQAGLLPNRRAGLVCCSLFIEFKAQLILEVVVFVVVMELDKMDENDWKYHGEGNKSLVVSHVQVSWLS